MSEIPFITALGDAIDRAIAPDATAPRPARRRLRLPRGRGRLITVVAALAVGGVAYAATRQNSTTLATGGIACIAGTDFSAHDDTYNVQADGQSPQQACARVWRSFGQPDAALAAPSVKLVACADPHGFVDVFKSTGSSGQCKTLGLAPLQTRSYLLEARRVRGLVKELTVAGDYGRCVPPRTLVARSQRVLDRLGWIGWHAELWPRLDHGPCGLFMGSGRLSSDPSASLDGQKQVVWIIAQPATARPQPSPRPAKKS